MLTHPHREKIFRPTSIVLVLFQSLHPSRFPGAHPDSLREAAIRVAQRFKLPITVTVFDPNSRNAIRALDKSGIIRPVTFFGFYELEEINAYLGVHRDNKVLPAYRWLIRQLLGFKLPYSNANTIAEDAPARMQINKAALQALLRPGLNHFYMHAAEYEKLSAKPIPKGRNHAPDIDRIARLSHRRIWSDPEMRNFLRDIGVHIINYSDLRKLQLKRYKNDKSTDGGAVRTSE